MKQAKVLSPLELKRLLRVVSTTKHPERNRIVVLLSYLGGLRACEIASLRVCDVLSQASDKAEITDTVTLNSWQTKGAKSQTLVLNSQLKRELGLYLAKLDFDTPDKPLINSQKGEGFTSQTIQNLFRNLYRAAGILNASSHSGRRSYITTLSERGVSVRVIQALARHSSLVTTQRYIDVSVDKLRAAVEQVLV
jgi:integrase/recombinase XerD